MGRTTTEEIRAKLLLVKQALDAATTLAQLKTAVTMLLRVIANDLAPPPPKAEDGTPYDPVP